MNSVSQIVYVNGLVDGMLAVGSDADIKAFHEGIRSCFASMNASPQLLADRITAYYRQGSVARSEPVSLAFHVAITFGDCLPYLNEVRGRTGLSLLRPLSPVEPKPVPEAPSVQVTPPAQVGTTTIVIAKQELRFGDPLTADNLIEIQWPLVARPEGTFTSIADLTLGPREALVSIAPNEPIRAWQITEPGTRATVSALVADGFVPVSIQLSDISGDINEVMPDDRVELVYTRPESDGTSSEIVIRGPRVLLMTQNTADGSGVAGNAPSVIIELTTADAQKLSDARVKDGQSKSGPRYSIRRLSSP